MSEQGYEFTIAQISAKLFSLKIYYCKEREKVTVSSKKNVSGTDQLYKSKWRFYKRLNFLDDHITPRQTFPNFNVGKVADGSETEAIAAAKPPNIQKLTKDTGGVIHIVRTHKWGGGEGVKPNAYEIVSDGNLNLNKNLLWEGGEYIRTYA